MVIGVAGLVVALVVGGVALYYGLAYSIERNLDGEARAGAAQVVALVDNGTLPNPVPITGVLLIQVVDDGLRVVAGSVTADRLTPLLRAAEIDAAADGSTVLVPGARAGLTGELRVVTETAGPANDRRTVIAAVPAGDLDRSTRLLRNILLLVFPALLLVLALIAWRVIGRTLRPVESLRTAAQRISGTGADEQLPVGPARDEIAALAATLNDMLRRLAAARERQRTFVADAAHELRSPLASLQIQLEVAEHLAQTGEGAELAREALVDVTRLTAIVDDLLLLARADAGSASAEAIAGAPDGQLGGNDATDVRELLGDLADRTARTGIAITVSPGEPVTVRTDAAKLRRALRSLLDNAVRAARSEVEMSVESVADSGDIVVAITDDGPGIAPADRQRVFERFTRLDDARSRDTGGSGLGLPIAAELMRQLGGSVVLTDRRPAGLQSKSSTVPPPPAGLRAELHLPPHARLAAHRSPQRSR